MNININAGTTVRSTTSGLVATRGKRELHILGTSVVATKKAHSLLALHSFDKLFRAGKTAGAAGRNVRYISLKAVAA